MLEKTEGTITNEQYRDIGNFEYKEQEENKQNRKNNTTRKLDEQHGFHQVTTTYAISAYHH
jgi:hypothetical protein